MTQGFNPDLDGLAFAAPDAIQPEWLDAWQKALQQHAPEAEARLRESYRGAVDLHNVPAYLTRVDPADSLVSGAWVFAALDHYNWPSAVPSRSETLDAYLRERHRAFWDRNGSTLLEWLAIARRIPEEWLPRKAMERQIARGLQRTGIATAVDVQINLRLPVPGGRQWLRDRSAAQWRKAHAAVAAGQVCSVAVFAGDRVTAMLAFWGEGGLRCYDPTQPEIDVFIEPASVDGLLCLDYAAAEPPRGTLQKLASRIGLRRTVWRSIRAWRKFRHASL